MERTLKALIDDKKVRFVFVGGKGGVGKTTTSASLALAMAADREKVLLISTDPAHNLADAFNQQLGSEPTLIHQTSNLWAMEIDSRDTLSRNDFSASISATPQNASFFSDLLSQVPGIDEAIAVMSLIKLSKEKNYDLVVFDTAPTGHTLKLIGYPAIFEKFLEKVLSFKDKLGVLTSLMGKEAEESLNKVADRAAELREDAQSLLSVLKDNELTTFVAVCIPEFLSVYETERLIQELATKDIDVSNIVVNQIVFPEDECKKCHARYKMQHKYINQITQLYEDFNICMMPMADEEVRGLDRLKKYSDNLQVARELPPIEK